MKRYIILALALLTIVGCSRKQQALSYLQEEFPRVEFSIEEVGPVVPLYYPGFELMGIASKMKDPDSEEFRSACEHFEAAMKPEQYAKTHPEECDGKGFTAWVNYPGGMLQVTFFYADGKTKEIFSSTLELQKQYDDILKTAFGL